MPLVGKPGLYLAAVVLAGTAACGGAIDQIRRADPQGTDFSAALAREYRALAIFESDEMFDHGDAGLFARKGLRAARGETVLPEDASGWDLAPEDASEVAEARSRLLDLLDNGARVDVAEAAARTQVKFDCWVEQLEESFQNDHIAACRDQFFQALAATQGSFGRPPVGMAPPPPPPPPAGNAGPMTMQPPPPPPAALQTDSPIADAEVCEPRAFLVFFDFDSVALDAGGGEVVDLAAEYASDGACRSVTITVAGHTDTMGSPAYNAALSMRRARVVERRLVERGLEPQRIRATARGEGELRIVTPDQTREAENRRVEIEIAP